MGNCLQCLQTQTDRNQTMSSSVSLSAAAVAPLNTTTTTTTNTTATTTSVNAGATTALSPIVSNGGAMAGGIHSTKKQQQKQQQSQKQHQERYTNQYLYIAYPQATTDNEHIKSSALSATTATTTASAAATATATVTTTHYQRQQQTSIQYSTTTGAEVMKSEGTEMSHPANRLTSLKNFGQHCEVKRNSFKKSLAFLGNGNLIGAATITSNSTTVTNTMATARGDGGCVGAKNPGQQQKVCKSSLKGFQKTAEVSDNKLNQLFEEYKDPDDDLILAEGIERLCHDLNYQPDEFAILVLAWCLNASQMCRFTRPEFIEGLQKIKADTIPLIRRRLEEIIEVLNEDAELFKQLYRFTFRFGLEPEQRILSLDMAISLWRLVFTVQTPKNLIDSWLHFLEQHPTIRGIPKDTWNMFLNFSEQCDIDKYDDTEAWPSLFDDFVDYERYRLMNATNSQQSSTAAENHCTNLEVISNPPGTTTTPSSSLSTPSQTTSTRPNSLVVNETTSSKGGDESFPSSPSNVCRSNDIS